MRHLLCIQSAIETYPTNMEEKMKSASANKLLAAAVTVLVTMGTHAQTDYTTITEDMCFQSICLKQDIGTLPPNIQWDNSEALTSSRAMAARNSMVQKGIELCTDANAKQWAKDSRKMCEVLLMASSLPPAEVIGFFRTHRGPVCNTGGKGFNFQVRDEQGSFYVRAVFGRDGRPRVMEVFKHYNLLNASDSAKFVELVKEKHPYVKETSGRTKAPWGGSVEFFDFGASRGPRYGLYADSEHFAQPRVGPDEGVCAIESRSLSIK
jgi:hypothetical protein